MKVAFITDTHAGIKNGSDVFLDYAEQFYTNTFFPYLLTHGITHIIHMGDYFDNRRNLHIKTLHRTRAMFVEKLREYGMTMDIIPGNHDTYYKNTNEVCSLVEFFEGYSGVVNLHMKPTVVSIDGCDIALLPWINTSNFESSMEFVNTARASILCGHLELSGFEMMKGAPAISHGMDASCFDRYEAVYSGHYHTKSSRGNVHYLGVPFEQTWADCDDTKYFHVFDTHTRECTPVRVGDKIFKRIIYDDRIYESPTTEMKLPKKGSFSGCFVKIIVAHKKDIYAFDRYIDAISADDPFEYKIVENLAEYNPAGAATDDIDVADTITLLNASADAYETSLDKNRLKQMLQALYVEAQNTDSI